MCCKFKLTVRVGLKDKREGDAYDELVFRIKYLSGRKCSLSFSTGDPRHDHCDKCNHIL